MLRRAALAVVLLVAAVAAGCGGDGSKTIPLEDYELSVVSTRDRVDFALAQITRGTGTRDELLVRMDQAAGRIDSAADDFEEAGPAKGFEDETDELSGALHELSADLGATAEQARQEGFEDIFSGARGLSFDSWDKANAVLDSLRKQGIDVQPIGRH